MISRTPTPTIQNQPLIEELTAQRAKALEEDRKDALRKLDHYEREPVTFNAGERVTDLVRTLTTSNGSTPDSRVFLQTGETMFH